MAAVAFSAAAQPQPELPLTAYPGFTNPCFAYTTGGVGGQSGAPALGGFAGPCSGAPGLILFSVTQEDEFGNHDGSLNFDRNKSSYMADYLFPEMLGTTLNMHGGDRRVLVSLDTTANAWEPNPRDRLASWLWAHVRRRKRHHDASNRGAPTGRIS